MADKKKTRKWVVRAIVAFLVIMLLLTFFSNTIMNATIPKVVAEKSTWGTLSFATTVKGNINIDNKVEYKVPKELAGRKVKSVEITEYDEAIKDQTVAVILEAADEDDETYKTTKETLEEKLKDQEYANRTPATKDTTIEMAEADVKAKEEAVRLAEADLNLANNRDATIAQANQTINDNTPALNAANADFEAASASIEAYNARISEIDTEISSLQDTMLVFERMGTPIPQPTPADAVPVTPEKGSVEELMVQMDNLQMEKISINENLEDAQNRQNNASAEKARLEGIINEATAVLESAETTKTADEARKALEEANKDLAEARTDLSNAQVNAGIESDKKRDSKEKENKEIEDLKKKLEEYEKNMKITEIKAPADGQFFKINVGEGDELTEKTVLFSVLPEDRKGSVEFTVKAEDCKGLAKGMELQPDSNDIDSIIITSIKPDSADPRNSKIVKCDVVSDFLFQDYEISVTISKSNQNYENIVPSSAVIKDNSGEFVYALVESSTPLGSKFTVKKIDVQVEASDGMRTAIKGEKLDSKYQYITRSEEPLKDGDRVRLQDYSKKE